MKEARKALETSSLGKKPRFSLSQLIQSVVMTRTTTEVRVNRTVLQETRHSLKNIRHHNTDSGEGMFSGLYSVSAPCQGPTVRHNHQKEDKK